MQAQSPQKLNLPQVVHRKRHKNRASFADADAMAAAPDVSSIVTHSIDTFESIVAPKDEVISTTTSLVSECHRASEPLESAKLSDDESKSLSRVAPKQTKKKSVRIVEGSGDASSINKPQLRTDETAPVEKESIPSHPSSSWLLLGFLSFVYVFYLSCVFFGDSWLLGVYTHLAADPPFVVPSHSLPLIFNTSILSPAHNSLSSDTLFQWRVDGSALLLHRGQQAVLRVELNVDGENITFPDGNTFNLTIDEQVNLTFTWTHFCSVTYID